ncbi:MAG: N-acetylmuramoyl-L-alanine amidase [Alcanivoracaceae bacterium]|nr:N-acetylmuramoyl-L-alanine amidase [Alcanivoracaceae bacterium]
MKTHALKTFLLSHNLFFLLKLFLIVLSQSANALTVVSGARVTTKHNIMKAVFDVSKPVQYNYFQLHNPPRLVIDVYHATFKNKVRFQGNNIVKKIRIGKQANNTLRLVFDLTQQKSVKLFKLKPKGKYEHRLLVKISKLDKKYPIKKHITKTTKTQKIKSILVKEINNSKFRDIIIAIDAGHGGNDTGAIGPSGSTEKDISLSIAKKLAASINKEVGMKAILIRKNDTLIPLARRFLMAEKAKADLFVSIHTNANKNSQVNGLSIYVLRNRSARSKSNLYASVKSANSVLFAVKKTAKLHKKNLMRAGFMVLKSRKVPSMLIETAYISNPSDEKKLKNKEQQQKLANAIKHGIKSYFYQTPPTGSWIAQQLSTKKHKVKRGDTLSSIAQTYHVSLRAIKRLNNKRSSRIYVGEVLALPL